MAVLAINVYNLKVNHLNVLFFNQAHKFFSSSCHFSLPPILYYTNRINHIGKKCKKYFSYLGFRDIVVGKFAKEYENEE